MPETEINNHGMGCYRSPLRKKKSYRKGIWALAFPRPPGGHDLKEKGGKNGKILIGNPSLGISWKFFSPSLSHRIFLACLPSPPFSVGHTSQNTPHSHVHNILELHFPPPHPDPRSVLGVSSSEGQRLRGEKGDWQINQAPMVLTDLIQADCLMGIVFLEWREVDILPR